MAEENYAFTRVLRYLNKTEESAFIVKYTIERDSTNQLVQNQVADQQIKQKERI
jgi:hypothetical protein